AALGDDNSDVALCLNDLGMARLRAARPGDTAALGEAEDALRAAIAIHERSSGADHPDTAAARLNLADAMHRLGHCDQATAIARRAIATFDQLGNGLGTASGLVTVGGCQLAGGHAADAVSSFERAIALRIAADVAPALIGDTRIELGRALWQAGRRDE